MFVVKVELYDPKTITKEKIRVISKTNLIDFIEEEYQRFPDDPELQAEFQRQQPLLEARREKLFEQIDNEPEEYKLVKSFFDKTELIEELKRATPSNLTTEYLSASEGITPEALESYYKFGKFKYECGMYDDAEEMLGNFLSVIQPQSSSVLGARWGRLACRILGAKWDLALHDLAAVKEAIEIRNVTPMDQIRQRAWLLHWALFVHINQRDGVDALADFFSEKVYLQTLENLCPWLMRYYTAFVVLSPSRRQKLLRDVLQGIQAMAYQYSDPMTEFLYSLFNQFDFDEAQQKLQECQALMKNDFFLQIYADKFMYEARVLICEMFCTINKRVDLVMLADKLQMSEEEVEKWMVDMVRNGTVGATADAKIDSSAKQVIMAPPSRVAHQTVVEKTRDLTARSGMLSNNLSTLLQDQGQATFIRSRFA